MNLRNVLISIPIFALAIPAIAQRTMIDADGDGQYSFPEVQVAVPETTLDTFTALDSNGDGLLDADEIAIGEEAGLLPTQES